MLPTPCAGSIDQSDSTTRFSSETSFTKVAAVEPVFTNQDKERVTSLGHNEDKWWVATNLKAETQLLACVRHQDWFMAIDLKNAYSHVSFLRFVSLIMEGMEDALAPPREVGIRIIKSG